MRQKDVRPYPIFGKSHLAKPVYHAEASTHTSALLKRSDRIITCMRESDVSAECDVMLMWLRPWHYITSEDWTHIGVTHTPTPRHVPFLASSLQQSTTPFCPFHV
jgi:hypothetical protein